MAVPFKNIGKNLIGFVEVSVVTVNLIPFSIPAIVPVSPAPPLLSGVHHRWQGRVSSCVVVCASSSLAINVLVFVPSQSVTPALESSVIVFATPVPPIIPITAVGVPKLAIV